jgi:uncharacterized radical SAM superfamily Fe-S cluster-containing enzyme
MDAKRKRKIEEKEKEKELKVQAEQSTAGEQLDLIDVTPENLKKIIPVARAYRKVVKERVEFTNRETALKADLLNLVKEAKLKRLANGKIRFKSEGLTITITPMDEKISIKEEKDKKNEPDID